MTVLSAVRDGQRTTDSPRTSAELDALFAVLEQVRQVRADQREAMAWLAEHAEQGGPA